MIDYDFCFPHPHKVGCVNSLKANVELFKNEIPISIKETNFKTQQYLSVIVPEELRDYAFIQVQIVKSNYCKYFLRLQLESGWTILGIFPFFKKR